AIPSFHQDVMNRLKVLTEAFLFSGDVPAYLLFLPLNPEFVHQIVLIVLAPLVNWTLLFLRMQLRKIRHCLYPAGILAASRPVASLLVVSVNFQLAPSSFQGALLGRLVPYLHFHYGLLCMLNTLIVRLVSIAGLHYLKSKAGLFAGSLNLLPASYI